MINKGHLTDISLTKGNVKLSFFVDNKTLKLDHNPMHSLLITDGQIGGEEIFWDNIKYFLDMTPIKIAESTEELANAGQYYDNVFNDIEYLINECIQLGYLNTDDDE